MQRVLPDPKIKQRLADLAVGLASNCDAPEQSVEQLMRANLPNARTLPFVAFVSHDGKWVRGFSGFRDAAKFAAELAAAEKSPLLNANPAARAALAKLVAKAEKAAGRKKWKSVLQTVRAASEYGGRCPERDAIQAVATKARDWINGEFDAVIERGRSGAGLGAARKKLGQLKRTFAGEPEAAEAEAGLQALKQLGQIRGAEMRSGGPKPERRKQAAEKWKDSRWAAMFTIAEPDDEKKKAGG